MTRLSTCLLLAFAVPALSPAETLVVRGATVHTLDSAGSLSGADVVVADGRVVAVGESLEVPRDARVIDASGKILTPGLMAPLTRLGLSEVKSVKSSVDYRRRSDQFTAAFEVAGAYNPLSTLIPVSRVDGFTNAAIVPASDATDDGTSGVLFGGMGAVVQLGGGDGPVLKPRAMMVAYLGRRGGELAGGSRAMALMKLHQALADAAAYRKRRRSTSGDHSLNDGDLKALRPVVGGDLPILIHANRASDLRAALDLAKEFDLRLIVAGGAEAWMLAADLAAADAAVILDATANLPVDFDQLNARLDNAALLAAAGVGVTFGAASGRQQHNVRNLRQAAGIAVANGLEWKQGLRAITLTPSRLYGMDDELGSITPGKRANLVIWNGDPLELTSYPERVFIDGIEMPRANRQTMLRDRYRQSGSDLPPAYRY